MNSQRLKYFLTAAQTLNLTRTAKIHYISQTAVTAQIKSLEADIGVELFDRAGRRMKLTPAGAYFAEGVQSLLSQEDALIRRTRELAQEQPGELRLGLLPECTDTLAQRMAMAWMRQHPQVNTTLRSLPNQRMIELVQRGELDACFAFLCLSCDQAMPEKYVALEREHMGLLLPPESPLAAQETVSPEQVRRESVILLGVSDSAETQRDFYGITCCDMLGDLTVVDSLDAMAMMIRAGKGAGMLCSFHAQIAAKRYEFKFVPIDCCKARPLLALVLPDHTPSTATRQFAEFCEGMREDTSLLP